MKIYNPYPLVIVRSKRFLTIGAFEIFYSCMHFNMLVQITLLSELPWTLTALIRPLACVGSYVVEQIDPFMKVFFCIVFR